jgi:hypothetical protein
MEPAFWNAIANHPDVRPHIGGEGSVDLTDLVTDPANFCLQFDHGGFICLSQGQGVYSVHSQFLAEGRNATTAAMREGCDFMFTRTDCMTLTTQLPDNNQPAANLAAMTGFVDWFRKDHDPLLGPSTMARLDIHSWIMGPNGAHLADEGKDFHELLETAKLAKRSALPIHPDDDAHDRYVGAACCMAKRGNIVKGVSLYNLWASAAGYVPLRVMSLQPPVVDVVDAVIGLGAKSELEVLLCR